MIDPYGPEDWERWSPEYGKSPARTAFERDRARVLHSAALRRLGAKTQVQRAGSDDFVRTRLTHSLEVAQVGRELGKALGCDPDVVDTACLAHDLGHPPFGHNGERILDDLAADIGGFEGNAQTLRLLTRLESKVFDARTDRSAGLNLTRASLDAVSKYPWIRGGQSRPGKFGVYQDDLTVFEWLRAGAPVGRRCLEAQVMDFADDVAYSVHDLEDAIVGGHFDGGWLDDAHERTETVAMTRAWYDPPLADDVIVDRLRELTTLPYWVRGFDGSRRALAALKDLTSQLIGRFCAAVEQATRAVAGDGRLVRYRADLVIPDTTAAEITGLKGLAVRHVMAPRAHAPAYRRQQDIVADLVHHLVSHGPSELEKPFADDWSAAAAADDAARLRVVIDQVASLTDVSAVAWHDRLVGHLPA